MTGWLEIAVVAFVAQLAVLPGEKAQFIIAGLSTRYEPLVVVSAAGAAFAGWTALEILFGQALKAALSPVVLDAFTAVLFLAFAVLLWRSAPSRANSEGAGDPVQSDGGVAETSSDHGLTQGTSNGGLMEVTDDADLPTVFGRDLSDTHGGFVPIFLLMAAGEFGDKTQLVTIGLAAKFGATSAIWVGEMAAIIPVSLANAYFFHRFSGQFDARKAHFFAATLFAFFAVDTVLAITTGFSVWEQVVGSISAALLAAI